jgi:sarcosine oxidase gamma subunit
MRRTQGATNALLDPRAERRAAEQDEHARFNAACARSGPVPLQTATGLRLVWRVTPDWWYVCGPDDTTAPSLPGRNDATWAALLAWVGELRHPLFATRRLSRNGRQRG